VPYSDEETTEEYWARHGERQAARVFLAWIFGLAVVALAIIGLGVLWG
jgi:hypothetical protein